MRYFFNLHECGTITRDHDGQEFDDLAAVREAAIRTARGIMAAEIESGRLCLLCHIEIQDRDGTTVMILPFRQAVVVTGL